MPCGICEVVNIGVAFPSSFLQPNLLFQAAYMDGIFGRRSLDGFLLSCGQVSDEADDEVSEEQRRLRLGRSSGVRISESIA